MDSLYGLSGVTDIFRAFPDWSSDPSQSNETGRQIIQHNLGKSSIRVMTDKIGASFIYGFTNMDKSEEGYVVGFFAYPAVGRRSTFWVPIYDRRFVPQNAFDGYAVRQDTDLLRIDVCGFDGCFRGDERLFILRNDGDLLTRKILSVDEQLGYEEIKIDTSVDNEVWEEDIYAEEIDMAGILAYCRLDQDELEVSHETPFVSSCELTFKELAQEYEELVL